MIKKYNRGFTLIELLVVIAIIGILSGIVITALSGARDKAYDAKVKADLAGFRTAAELYYNNNGNSYGDLCNENPTTGPYLSDLGPSANCNFSSDEQQYAIDADLKTGSWCVDSGGNAGVGVVANSGGVCVLE
ncbi:MAG: type pilus assembly protein PilA [Patescibacteria group bacterium]|nr:type pilus assembly protein PilA [Patescibacteria group bacterium]